ncbi:MAG TPA: 23S rRNA (adenine(2030)-N(6))-methyltransferase RlmJ [Marinobacter sp.]|nr:23S rRNA (adenine(2030)-N(6))-methyltransferase RlmJ [Marinobacter sp.]
MLSYLHAFHAGNFADVHKHATLVLALNMMQAKASGIACIDTHAGSALYDLDDERARKTAEADAGIRKLWPQLDRLAAADWQLLRPYLQQLNPGTKLRHYPGSPAWFGHFLRGQDHLSAFELHPSETSSLSQWASGKRLRVTHQDGLAGLLKVLPPRLPRLLVLIDPSYEVKTDYTAVAKTLARAWQKCRHGVFLVWYPMLTSGLEQTLLDTLRAGPIRKILRHEVRLQTLPERGMVGSGMLVINPPWGMDERLSAMMSDLKPAAQLGLDQQMDWLVSE